jgi:predicted nucleic acid-binding protein
LASVTKIIIDSNIVFSAILNTDSRIGQIIINGAKHYRFYAPDYIRTEIIQHKEKIMQLAKLDDLRFIETYDLIFRNIIVLNHSLIPLSIYRKAEHLCSDIDIDDTTFVALTEFIKGRLWTGDIKLINGLQRKGYKRFIKTDEIYQDFLHKQKESRK